ncbi:MAG: LuxR C-terminal-related transcriptional regulator [Planctomycetota bacterium]|nr:LuxR C-terminal-related transcriptional regulator [Planctomycetota bacterium]
METNVQPGMREWDQIAGRWSWSRRECEVVRLLVLGFTRKQSALKLQISLSTLQTHFRRAMWKGPARDLVGLIWEIVAVRDELRHRERTSA